MAARSGFSLVVVSGVLAACGGSGPPGSAVAAAPTAGSRTSAGAAPTESPLDAGIASAPLDAEIARIVERGKASTTGLDVTRSLADHVGPRIVGSAGYDKAVTWAVATMNELGLQRVHTEPVLVQRWERGVETAEIVASAGARAQRLETTALGDSPATGPAGILASIVEADSMAALEKLPDAEVRGRIVFFNKPMERTHDGSGYGHAVDVRANGPALASLKGARAVIVRSVTGSTERYAHTGAMRRSFAAGSPYEHAKAIPAAAISVPDAELVHRLLAEQHELKVKLVLTPRDLGAGKAANVIGEITGASEPASVVVFGAHLDSWDLATGAQDDASGCGIVLGAARILLDAKVKPAKTVRVVLYAGEENGVFGAKAYAKDHAAEVGNMVAAIEADEGADRVYETRVLGEHNATFDALAAALGPLDVKGMPEPAHGGSDTGFLGDLGVPLVDLQQDMQRYFDIHHSKDDVMDRIDHEAIAQATTANAIAAAILSRPGATLGRAPEKKKP